MKPDEPAFVFPLLVPPPLTTLEATSFYEPFLVSSPKASINNPQHRRLRVLTYGHGQAPALPPKCCNYCPALFCTPSTIIPPFIMTRNTMRFRRVDFISASTLPQTSPTSALTSDDAIKFQQCGSTNSHFDNAELRPTQAVSSELRHSAF